MTAGADALLLESKGRYKYGVFVMAGKTV